MAGLARQRLDDLLLARATEGLDAAEALELERLLAAETDVDAAAYERAAATVCLAVIGGGRSLPPGLRARLEKGAVELAAQRRTTER
jgi:hypothetical protein